MPILILNFCKRRLALTTNPDGTSGGFTSAGLDCGRTVNDFMLSISLTKGGTAPGLCVLQVEAAPGGGNGCGFDYVDATAAIPAGKVYGAVNQVPVTIPNCPSGTLDTYQSNSFAEVSIDLSALISDIDPCLTSGSTRFS